MQRKEKSKIDVDIWAPVWITHMTLWIIPFGMLMLSIFIGGNIDVVDTVLIFLIRHIFANLGLLIHVLTTAYYSHMLLLRRRTTTVLAILVIYVMVACALEVASWRCSLMAIKRLDPKAPLGIDDYLLPSFINMFAPS